MSQYGFLKVSESPQEAATNLEQVKAEIEEGLESAKKLVQQTKFLLGGDGAFGEAEQA